MLSDALAASRELNARLAVAASGVEVAYPPKPGDHPLVGRRIPNLELADGSDVFGLLRRGLFCLIGLAPGVLAENAGARTVSALTVTAAGFAAAKPPWDTVGSALIRPDGHLAWAADGTTDPATRAADATAALLRWLPGIAGARHYQSAAS